ncbi:hypothetical protein V6R21_10400 [Limibacter armeniacum]|uniref:hypothetical protein n=1 Tax=Limibacter armeniacum TaxID=466084 RepID=UPI002FE57334
MEKQITTLYLFLVTFISLCILPKKELKAQDLKTFEIQVSPLVIPLAPIISFNRELEQAYALFYNVNSNFAIGVRYSISRFSDIYTAQDNSNLVLLEEPNGEFNIDLGNLFVTTALEQNINYSIESFSLLFRYNFAKFRTINPFVAIPISYNYRSTRIKKFSSVSNFGNEQYLLDLSNASEGFDFSSPPDFTSRDDIVPVPFNMSHRNMSIGVLAGIEWNINRTFSINAAFTVVDFINRIGLPNTEEVQFIRKTGPDAQTVAELITLPNLQDDQIFKDPNTSNVIAYLGQSTSEEVTRAVITFEVSFIFKCFFKK